LKTICVTGGNGLLGNKVLAAAEHDYQLVSIDLAEEPLNQYHHMDYIQADICDLRAMQRIINRFKPSAVIHTAAMTNVDRCESDREMAWQVNVVGAGHVAMASHAAGAKMIHVSTDYVFDGKNGPYSETDEPNPISYYGLTKLEGERAVLDHHDHAAIARTMILYGFVPQIRLNFMTWLIQSLGKGETVRIVTDQYGNPTLADDLAEALILLYKKGRKGIYHTAGSSWLNRYETALAVADVFQLDAKLVRKATTARLKQPAPRPMQGGLICDKLARETGFVFSDLQSGLKKLKEQMLNSSGFDKNVE